MTNYNYGELHLSPVWKGRDFKTGRFLKGHTPANKGKKWNEFMDKRSQKRSAKGWKNLELFRCKGGGPNSGRPKKAVIAVMDNGGWKIFSYTAPAAEFVDGRRENVLRCCHQNASHGKNTDHRYKGVRFYFENDNNWINKISQRI